MTDAQLTLNIVRSRGVRMVVDGAMSTFPVPVSPRMSTTEQARSNPVQRAYGATLEATILNSSFVSGSWRRRRAQRSAVGGASGVAAASEP